jgi:hypothetical protein
MEPHMGCSNAAAGSGGACDAVLVIPPPSPSDTNPPLGPAIIARVAQRAGFNVRVIDLNALHISRFREIPQRRDTVALGDHGKDRLLVARAARHLYEATGLYGHDSEFLPEGADPVAGMHYQWEAIRSTVLDQSGDGTWWQKWLERDLFGRFPEPPAFLGVSVMGASQVFTALVIFRLVKRCWPGTVTVAGGSHITLLADEIRREPRYRDGIDLILPGHSEDWFADLLRRGAPQGRRVDAAALPSGSFEYIPLFDPEQLDLYRSGNLTIPLQFTRGCAYARCTFCTYPAVEPVLTRFDPSRAGAAVRALVSEYGVRRFSLKDSLFTVPMMESFALALAESDASPVSWSATTKVTRRLGLIAPMLAESGLATVELGIESIRPGTQELFDKRASLAMVEDVILALAAQKVMVVINLIFGAPGETLDDAERQLAWYGRMRVMTAGYVDGSLNLLEIVRGSPMERVPPTGVVLSGVAPWAYCYQWNAPKWRTGLAGRLAAAELARQQIPATAGRGPRAGLVSGGRRRTS